jgi:hypothetical protein
VRAIPNDGPGRLLFFVEQRLAQLGWTREDLATQGGPSPSTFYKLVRQAVRPTARTIVRLDRALGWEAGSSHAVMAGGAPSLSVSCELATVSARIDAELACCQDSGAKKTAAELRDFLMDVASRLGAFYTGADGRPGEAGDARAG